MQYVINNLRNPLIGAGVKRTAADANKPIYDIFLVVDVALF
jgi:hypothetical protein